MCFAISPRLRDAAVAGSGGRSPCKTYLRSARLLSAYEVETVGVPPSWVGRTLSQVDPYREYGVTVLAIESTKGLSTLQRVPNPYDPLSISEKMIVLGTAEQVHRLKRAR